MKASAREIDRYPRRSTWGAFAIALTICACGARNDLPGVGDAADDGDGAAIAEGRFFFATATAFQGESRVASMRDMSGDGYATYAGTGDFFGTCVRALDSRGMLLLTDDETRRVLRLDVETGRLDEAPFPGSLASAYDVAVDADDRVYIADAEGNRVIRYDRFQDGDGFAFGGAGSGVGQLSQPRGVAITPDGKIVIADTENGRIVQVDDLVGNGWKAWTVPSDGARPWDVAVDRAGGIYVADFQNAALWRIDDIDAEDGVFLPLAGYQPSHVFVDADGRIYVTSLNGVFAVLAMDDIQGNNLVAFTGTDEQPLFNPCGVVVR